MRISLLRHGATVAGDCYCGSSDVALSDVGRVQMQHAVAGRHWDRILSSPLQRCAGFARALARARELPYLEDARLSEMHFGDWEGRSAQALMVGDAPALLRFWEDPLANPPPGAEPLSALSARLRDFLRDLLCAEQSESALQSVDALPATQQILLVTHGGPMRVLRAHAAGCGLERLLQFEVPHAALIDFTADQLRAFACGNDAVASTTQASSQVPVLNRCVRTAGTQARCEPGVHMGSDGGDGNRSEHQSKHHPRSTHRHGVVHPIGNGDHTIDDAIGGTPGSTIGEGSDARPPSGR